MHNGGETTTASFEVSVEDGNEDGSTPPASTFNLTVTPVNDRAGADRRSAADGSRRRQLRDHRHRPRLHRCRRCDRGRPSRSRRPVNGQVQVSASTAVTALHRRQLAAGQVSFVHNGSETTTASFQVSVEDGNEDGSTPPAEHLQPHGHAGQRPAGADRRSRRHGPRRRQLRPHRLRPRLHRCRR